MTDDQSFAPTGMQVGQDVLRDFPALRINIVFASGLANAPSWPEVEHLLGRLETDTAAGAFRAEDESGELVGSWHEAYRRWGTNPRRRRPSVDALGRRLTRSGALPRINAAVDAYNDISVRHGLPSGAFDLDQVHGDIDIVRAIGDESFEPLGEPGTSEHVNVGEVIYRDSTGVLTRDWNHRDSHRTRVQLCSSRVVFILETLNGSAFGHILAAATTELVHLLRPAAPVVHVHTLSPETPRRNLT